MEHVEDVAKSGLSEAEVQRLKNLSASSKSILLNKTLSATHIGNGACGKNRKDADLA